MRCFELHRVEDISGVSGTGVVAQGVEFDDGCVALRWLTEWPTSVVFHDRGAEAVEHVHGHNGRTRVVWLDEQLAAAHNVIRQMTEGGPEAEPEWDPDDYGWSPAEAAEIRAATTDPTPHTETDDD